MIKRVLLLVAVLCSHAFAGEPVIVLKENDTWVMAGDSITAQRLHTNYIEAFFRTRYPNLHLHFRNSGIGGNKTGNVIERFDYDIAAWKPTIVSVELGMNDVTGNPEPERKDAPADYIAGMKKLSEKIRAIQAQPLFISSSPVNDGSVLGSWISKRCHAIHPFTEALKQLGQTENIPVIDQYHPLLAMWGPNRTVESAGTLASHIRRLKPEDHVPELEALQAFAKLWEGKQSGISLGGDEVHPGVVGQYTMAATILKALNVDVEVSSATVTPDGKVVDVKGCTITGISTNNGKLTFVRNDERSPWPLHPTATAALKLMPEIAGLSRYILAIPGLPAGKYRVSMNEKPVAVLTSQELAKGWNMGAVAEGPLGERAAQILSLINQLQLPLNNAWREASKEKNAEKLAAAQRAIDECEAKIHAACQPMAIRFSVEREE